MTTRSRRWARACRWLILPALVLGIGTGCSSPTRSEPPAEPPLVMAASLPSTPPGHDVTEHLAKFRTGDEETIREMTERLEGFIPRPWTVERLTVAFAASLDNRRAAGMVYLLAASRDPLGLRVAGNSIDDEDLDIRVDAAMGIWTYWLEVMSPAGNLETIQSDVFEWWEVRRAALVRAQERSRRSADPASSE